MKEHHLSLSSNNPKTGPIPVSTHSISTCPTSCKLIDSCYAKNSLLAIHWNKVSSGDARATTWDVFLQNVKSLAVGQLWRYAQAGDLPGLGDEIDESALRGLVRANNRKRGFAYTRKYKTAKNLELIGNAVSKGFIINISADNARQAARIFSNTRLPTVTLLPKSAPNDQTISGVRFVACPAQKSSKVTCATCGLCAQERDYVIGFRAHGRKWRKVEKIALGEV